ELLTASDSLWKNQEEPVVMSDDLREAALHLNEVRLDIIESRKAANEAEQRKNDLVVYLAHDLKTPLTSVIGYLTLLHDERERSPALQDRKSTRLNSSHVSISYAVFCLKKKIQ